MDVVSRREESELGAWTQLTGRPGALTGLVESIWLFDGRLSGRERYYPTGELDLIIRLDEPSAPFHIVEGQPATACPSACLTGLLVAPLVIETAAARSRLLGVRLRPAGALALFGLPQQELTGAAVDLHDLIGAEACRLTERLAAAGSDEARLRLVQHWLLDRLVDGPRPDPGVAYAVAEIERTGGITPIAGLIERVGASPKRFAAAFERQVGVKPKLFSRIVRFRGLAAALPAAQTGLSETALAHGYYDHAHMNADFREFAGVSPRQFLAATAFPDSPTLTG